MFRQECQPADTFGPEVSKAFLLRGFIAWNQVKNPVGMPETEPLPENGKTIRGEMVCQACEIESG
jgi:hypothetical protein